MLDRVGIAALIAGVVAPHATVLAQSAANYPSRAVRIVVPEGPGGATDIQGRLFSAKISQALGQQFVVDNRAGGGAAGVMAETVVAKATPDGYTLLAIAPAFTFSPALHKNYPVDPIKDFVPVTMMTRAPYLLVVPAAAAAKSVKELIELAREQPGKLNFGAGNIGTGTHLIAVWFMSAAKIKATYVPYKSIADETQRWRRLVKEIDIKIAE